MRKCDHYYCGTYVRSGRQHCTPHPMAHLVLEEIILDDLKTIIQSVDDLQELIRETCQQAGAQKHVTDHEKNRLNTELEKVRKLKKCVYEDYREELISKDEYITYRRDYLKKEEQLKKQLKSLMERPELDADTDIFETPWVKRLSTMRSVDKLDRDIVVEMLHEIKVYENHKIEITYNFSDELSALFKSCVQN